MNTPHLPSPPGGPADGTHGGTHGDGLVLRDGSAACPHALVTGYPQARYVLDRPGLFPRTAEAGQPPGLRGADGEAHARMRTAVEEALAGVDHHTLRRHVRAQAGQLLEPIAVRGIGDLMGEYADILPLRALLTTLGTGDDTARHLESVWRAGTWPERRTALVPALDAAVAADRLAPGGGLLTRLRSALGRLGHDTGATAAHLVAETLATGAAATTAWTAQTLLTLLHDPRTLRALVTGTRTTARLLEEVAARQAPLARSGDHVTAGAVELGGLTLPAGTRVQVDLRAVASTSPGLGRAHDHSHLGWGAGAHRCPSPATARLIAEAAVESVIDRLWQIVPVTGPADPHPGTDVVVPVHIGVTCRPAGRATPLPADRGTPVPG
ncbi:hypothetical protein ACIOEZ_29130 [Streptomyces sp. NPDC087866]|uniref:hypothetical protein n=1 Tax=unclassified Streptomyces TaxID=2593676 RepID=UPI0033AA4C91